MHNPCKHVEKTKHKESPAYVDHIVLHVLNYVLVTLFFRRSPCNSILFIKHVELSGLTQTSAVVVCLEYPNHVDVLFLKLVVTYAVFYSHSVSKEVI